jgi:type IX secretion system PorP/SprF family membrane protein
MKKIALFSFLVVTGISMHAQDVHFSQFMMAPMQLNPGHSGSESQIRANINYKEQWKSVASPYKTIAASYDMRISENRDGFWAAGINFYSDRAGDAKMGVAQGNLNAAYHLKIADGQTLGLGVMAGYAQRSISTDALTWGNQYDGMDYNAILPSGESNTGNFSKSFIDLGTGLVYTFQQGEKNLTGNNQIFATVGASLMHVHSPNYSFVGNSSERLFRKFLLHGNALIGIPHSRISAVPGFSYSLQGGARELVMGSSIRYRLVEDSHFTGFVTGSSLSLGVYYRNKDAVILMSQIQFGGFAAGFSYDMNVSDLTQASNGRGGMEISMRYMFPTSGSKIKSSRFF